MKKMNPQVFRAKAGQARKLAATYQDPPYCGDMLALARHWDELAAAVESFEKTSAMSGPSRPGRSGAP